MPRILRQPFQALVGRTGDSWGRSRVPAGAVRVPGLGMFDRRASRCAKLTGQGPRELGLRTGPKFAIQPPVPRR